MSRADVWIRGATVFDGVSSEPKSVAVAITGDRIAFVGSEPASANATEVVEADGLILCPGFIDSHASTGLGYTLPRAADNKLFQGVTTELVGNCGTSTAPIGPLLASTMEELSDQIGFEFDWRGLGEWIGRVEDFGLQFNSGTLVGHSTLRGGHCKDPREVGEAEVSRMVGSLDRAMSEGALGLSSGLVYAPGSFADTDELARLAAVAGRHGGCYVSHIRNERESVEAAVDEAIEIGLRGNLPALVSHLKVAERPNWGKMPGLIQRIESARERGQTVSFDVYPYAAVSTKLRTFLPKAIMDAGLRGLEERLGQAEWLERSHAWLLERDTDFSSMVLITESLPGTSKRSIEEVAGDYGRAPERMLTDVLAADLDAWIVYHCIDEADMDLAILWPDSMICSDSWSYPVNAPRQIGDPHPRTFGAFTRFLERYALTGKIPFGEAVRKVTSLPAAWFGLEGRGAIAEGAYADLVLLDPDRLAEKATYEDPRQMSEGCERVWVNGALVLADGAVLDATPGRFLRRRQDGD